LLTRGLTEPRYLGLMLVISSVALVALFMWRFSRRKPPVVAQAAPAEEVKPDAPVEEINQPALVREANVETPVQEAEPDAARDNDVEETRRYCVHCGQQTASGFRFCPQCGQGTQITRQCARCGLEYIPAGDMPSYCPACGEKQ